MTIYQQKKNNYMKRKPKMKFHKKRNKPRKKEKMKK